MTGDVVRRLQLLEERQHWQNLAAVSGRFIGHDS